ncbi:hypothetical protein [Mesorhizobium sp.]|uniref:hypothetical protein n=1 Tax=Mesorhizobium sp. TaxID=1871066 RepID=UPI0025C73D44|nr:hypothetical protein [Mesorhizobium sp.]
MSILVRGMHGLGDNLHQRAVIRQLMARDEVFLESSWVAPYHDLVAAGLKILRKATPLRTQSKNADREASLFHRGPLPPRAQEVRITYTPDLVRARGSVLAAMCWATATDYAAADFRMAVPAEWLQQAKLLFNAWQPRKPVLVYRPLVDRTEWGGCRNRNPDHGAYAALFDAIRDDFFVVSIADLVPGQEWIVSRQIRADVELHKGELDFETLAGLFKLSAGVFASPGFAVILAQAVGTPVACVFGGYENSSSFAGGARFSPTLGIDPINPCQCFSHSHACQKSIDIPAASARLRAFFAEAARHWPGCA